MRPSSYPSRGLKLSLLLAIVAFIAYVGNLRTIVMGDSEPAAMLPIVLLTRHTTHFDSFEEYYRKDPFGYAFRHTGHGYVAGYPLMTGIIATPFYAIPVLWMQTFRQPAIAGWVAFGRVMEKVTAAMLVAISVFLFFHTCIAMKATERAAFWLTVAFAFGTGSWSTASQALWMHGPGILFILLAVMLAAKHVENPRPKTALLLGTACGLAVAIRLNNVLFVAPLSLWVLWKRPRHIFRGLARGHPDRASHGIQPCHLWRF